MLTGQKPKSLCCSCSTSLIVFLSFLKWFDSNNDHWSYSQSVRLALSRCILMIVTVSIKSVQNMKYLCVMCKTSVHVKRIWRSERREQLSRITAWIHLAETSLCGHHEFTSHYSLCQGNRTAKEWFTGTSPRNTAPRQPPPWKEE